MITLFTVPKPFIGIFDVIQANAIRSWLKIPNCHIVLCGDDFGVAEASRKFGVEHISNIKHNKYRSPLLNSIFCEVERVAYRY